MASKVGKGAKAHTMATKGRTRVSNAAAAASLRALTGGTRIRAAVMRRRTRPFTIETLTLDAPRADEVLVRLVATGVCHTDIAMRDDRTDSPVPMILGHEGAGVVEAVGGQVRKVRRGDHVVLSLMSCGRCRFCRRGEPST